MAVRIDFDADFDEQAAQARAQRVMLPNDFYRLPAEKRAQAFTVSGLARLDQVQAVADALAKFQADGGTFEDFRKWAAGQDWSLPRHRLETIYRNAVQTAYMAGHWRRFDEVKEAFPYLMYDAINDSRVRPSHLAMDGVIRPVDDPIWKRWTPPCGHRCRCSLRSVSAREAQRRGGATQSIPAEAVPDEGWGNDPRGWSRTLRRLIDERLSVCGTATLARKVSGAAIQCLPAATKHLLMARAATYQGEPLPPPKQASADDIIEDTLRYKFDELYDMFVAAFSRRRAAWMDETGLELMPDRGLFIKQDGGWKIGKNERSRYVNLFADTLADPVMVRFIDKDGAAMDELAVFGHYRIRGRDVYLKLVYRWDGIAWEGWSAFAPLPKQWAGYTNEGFPIWVRK